MTEDAGFTEPAPDVPAEPVPDAEAAPGEEPAPDAEPAPEPAEDATAPDPSWLLDLRTQYPGSTLLEFAEDVHRRLQNLGG